MLTKKNLLRIVAKYRTNSDVMLSDLKGRFLITLVLSLSLFLRIVAKYYIHFPDSIPDIVFKNEIMSICNTYEVPVEYIQLLPPEIANGIHNQYNSQLDIYSSDFNATKALQVRSIISPTQTINYSDNLNSLKKHYFSTGAFDNTLLTQVRNSISIKKPVTQEVTQIEKSKMHIFDEIAAAAIKPTKAKSGEMTTVKEDINPPIYLIYQFMQGNIRVCVTIRRKSGVRGCLKGYIKAFDKHFNLLLVDVDEEYIPVTKAAKRKLKLGIFSFFNPRNNHIVLKRHLPQLLVRGDNVVVICKA